MIWEPGKFITFDVETSGVKPEYALQPWRIGRGDAWATSLAWVWRAEDGRLRAGGGLDPTIETTRELLLLAATNKATLVGWNVVFDVSILLAYGLEDLVMRCRWLDGMLLWRHLEMTPEYGLARSKKRPYGLKAFVKEHLPWMAGYESEIDFHDPDPTVRRKLHKYNIQDCVATYLGAEMLYDALEPSQLRAALLEAECLPLLAQANLRGMLVDTTATRDLSQSLVDTAQIKLRELAPHGVSETIVRSPKQLSKLLFNDWGLPSLKENTSKLTGKISQSTDVEVLHELAFLDPRAKWLREYREALNKRTKFCSNLLESVAYNGDDRTHPQAIPFGTYSGRMTYASMQGKNKDKRQTGFAIHQMSREKKYRMGLIAPPGYTLMEFDAAGQEYRWMAIASGDETMLQLCLPGEDAHSFMAAQLLETDYRKFVEDYHAGKPDTKKNRDLGKFSNLANQYRISAKRLRIKARVEYDLPMEMPQAELIQRTYQRSYKGVPIYWNKQIQLVKSCGYAETFAGRRVTVTGNWEKLGWSMGSTAINYRIQGTGADQKYLALAVLKPYFVKHNIYFGWDLHDGIYLYVPNAIVDRAAVEIKTKLDNLPYAKAWGFTPPIPLPFDVKVGASWGALVDWKPR
jgi:DNA polymerase-1